MKRLSIFAAVAVIGLVAVSSADAGIFGRGRGLFRGGWGSRNVGACGSAACNCGPACSPATCGPNGCSPAKSSSPKNDVAAPLSPSK